MKKLVTLLGIFFLLSLTIQAQEVDYKKLIKKDGKLYKKGSKKPFNGTSVKKHDATKNYLFKMSFKEGLRHGQSFYYYDTGELEVKRYFEKDKLEGYTYVYYKDGTEQNKLHYENGLQNGASSYYPSGYVKYEALYDGGRLQGDVKMYAETDKHVAKNKEK